MAITVRIAQSSDRDRIVAAYRAWDYSPGIGPNDTVWLAESAGQLIGAVRIVPENGTLVLRGMRVADLWRGRGIGSQMLRAIAIWLDTRTCYCVPYAHLVGFYGQIRFVEVAPASAPHFLAERMRKYQGRALNVTIMKRK